MNEYMSNLFFIKYKKQENIFKTLSREYRGKYNIYVLPYINCISYEFKNEIFLELNKKYLISSI